MRNIKKIIGIFSLILVLGLSALFINACANGQKLQKEYYAYYGERFMLPVIEGADFSVTDSDGKPVEMVLGGFDVSSKEPYKLRVNISGRKESAKIIVLERDAVNFYCESAYVFASLRKPVRLPAFRAIDGQTGKEVAFTTSLSAPSGGPAGENLADFTPSEIGIYTLTARTVDGRAEKSVAIEVAESVSFENIIAPMEKKQGEKMFVRTFGFKAELNTDLRFAHGYEKGSMKVTTNNEANISGGFQMTDFIRSDISTGKGFFFYVYNNSLTDITLSLNWGFDITLKTGAWTRVGINDYAIVCKRSANDIVKNYYDETDINGMLFNFYFAQSNAWQGLPLLEMYFSNFYFVPDMTPAQLNSQIDRLKPVEELQLSDEDAMKVEIDDIDALYYTFSDYERALVNYDKLNAVKNKFLWLKYPQTRAEDDVIVYFNSGMGMAQTQTAFVPGNDKINISTSSERFYADEGASTRFLFDGASEGAERYNLDLKIIVPAITNLSLKYDAFYTYIYNASENDSVYCAWASEDAGWNQPLLKNKWNLVYLTNPKQIMGKKSGVEDFNITNATISFASNPWNANSAGDFYMANIRALGAKTVMQRLSEGEDNAQSLRADVDLYGVLSEKSQRNIPQYSSLVSNRFDQISSRILKDFSSVDATQLRALREETEILSNIYRFANKEIKQNVETLFRRLSSAYINRFLTICKGYGDLPAVRELFYLYGTLNAEERAAVDKVAFNAYYNGFLAEENLTLGDVIAAFGSAQGYLQADFKIQSDSGIRDDDYEKIFNLRDVDVSFAFDAKAHDSTDAGSTRLKIPVTDGWDVLNMYLTVPSVTDARGDALDVLYFYVYNSSSVDYTLETHWQNSFTLKRGKWTKVYINDYSLLHGNGTREDLRGIYFGIHNNWNLQTPADLYFSSVRAANAKTVNTMIASLNLSNPDKALMYQIKDVYEMLTPAQKRLANYRDVALLIMRDLLSQYDGAITEAQKLEITAVYNAVEKISGQDALSKWYDDFYQNFVCSVVDNGNKKVTYYGTALGFDQVSVTFDNASGNSPDKRIPRLEMVNFGVYDEQRSLRLTMDKSTALWSQIYFTLKNPTLTDIVGEGIFAYIYNNMSVDAYAYFWPNRITLKAKSWNLVYFDNDSLPWVNSALADPDKIDTGNLKEMTFQLFYYNAGGNTQLYAGMDVYITPFKPVTRQYVNDAIAYVNGAVNKDNSFVADSVIELYENMSATLKTQITGYSVLKNSYYAYLNAQYAVGAGDRIIAFDCEGGAKQIFAGIDGIRGQDVALSNKAVFTAVKAYNGEKGSTLIKQSEFTSSTPDVWMNVRLVLVPDISQYRSIRFAVFNESANPYTVQWNGQTKTLESNAWTEVEFDLNGYDGADIALKIDFGNKLDRNSLYFSAIYGTK